MSLGGVEEVENLTPAMRLLLWRGRNEWISWKVSGAISSLVFF